MKIRTFDSLADLLAFSGLPPKPGTSRVRFSSDWAGTKTYEEAVALAVRGWPEGAAKVLAIRSQLDGYLRESTSAKSSSFGYDVVGDYVDVGRYLTGEPECCGVTVQEAECVRQPVIKIVVNLAVSSSVDEDAIFLRGAAVLAAVDLLESLGRRVELWGAKGTLRKRDRGTHETHVLLKAASHPVDVDRLAYCLCHRAFIRRILFGVMEQDGFDPSGGKTRPHPVAVESGVVCVPEILRRRGLKGVDLQNFIADICSQCGVQLQ
jgi:hypothetical protein